MSALPARIRREIRDTISEARAYDVERLGAILPKVPTRAQIVKLENELRKLQTFDIEPVHHFAKGIYARELTIPAGTIITGKVHRTEHLNIVSKGCITVWTEEGMKTVSAPFTMVSNPGTKRVGYAHEDTVWTTVHGTEKRDLEELERELIEPETYAIESDNLPALEMEK